MSEYITPREIPTSPEKRWPYKGWQGIDLTTAGNLFNPEQSFSHAQRYNTGKPESEWMGLEPYVTKSTMGLSKFPFTPDGTRVYELQKDYPQTVIKRVHPPFSYNKHELLTRPIRGELKNSFMQKIYAGAWIFDFGAATNGRFVKLVEQLRAQGQDVTVNMHTNLIEGFRQDGRLDEIHRRVGKIIAENERRYHSPVVTDQALIFDPKRIVTDIVKKNPAVDGLLLGYDHGEQHGVDMMALLDDPDIRDHTKVVHLANTHKRLSHGLIQVGDEKIGAFLRKLAQTPFAHPVRVAFDYSPLGFGRMSQDDQYNLLVETTNWMKNIQEGEDYTEPRILRINRIPRQTPLTRVVAA